MPIDSTADLLFRIGANSDDAESNILRFRSLFSKNFTEMGQEFEGWAAKTFGDLKTAAGIGTAGVAALATAVVVGAAAAVHAADQYEHYVEGIAKVSKVTGIAVEDVSRLKFAAQSTGTDFDSLSTGLAKFTSAVVKGAQGSEQQLAAFQRLGISQKDLLAGEHNMLPLLEQVAEHFANLASKQDRTAESRDLFGRSGTGFLSFLALGKDGLKHMADEADRLGLVIHEADVKLVHETETAKAYMQALDDAINIAYGKHSIGVIKQFKVGLTGLLETLTQGPKGESFFAQWGKNVQAIYDGAKLVAEAQERLGNKPLETAPVKGVEKTKEQYEGLSNVLHQVTAELAGFGSEEGKVQEKIDHLMAEMNKALEELKQKQAKGDLAPGVFDQELASWATFAERLPLLHKAMLDHIADQRKEAADQAATDLNSRLVHEMDQTRAVKEVEWNWEMDGLLNKYRADKSITYESEQALEDLVEQLRKAGLAKIGRAEDEAAQKSTEDLQKRLAERGAKSLASEHQVWDAEMDALRESYQKKLRLTAENEALIAQLRTAGHAQIDAANKAAFDSEMARLQEQAQKILAEHMTSAERIAAQYQADVVKFTAAEEKKALALATSEAQRAQIMAQFAAIRKGLYDKEQTDLQQVQNSQGWQGVFGAKFGQMIRGNEALSKEWAGSLNQSQMMVRVTMEGLREVGQQTFEKLGEGMGSNIASAMVYSKSIGEAMRNALASTLESLAAQGMTYAIFSTALGFLRLAQWDFAGAEAAFTSAAIWGSVGAAAAVAGRAVAGPQNQAGAAGGGGAPAPGAGSSSAQSGAPGGSAAGSGGPHVTVNVWGHIWGVSGVQEMASVLNDAVLNKDVTLTSTNTKNGVQVTR